MNGFERNRQSVEALFSSIDAQMYAGAMDKVKKYAGKRINSQPIEITKIIDDGKNSGFFTFQFKSGNDTYQMTYDYGFGGEKDEPLIKKVVGGEVQSSRRPIKSGWVFIFGTDKAAVYENDNADTYKVECRNGCTFIDEYFDNEQDAREFAIEVSEDLSQSHRPIKSSVDKNTLDRIYNDLVSILKFDGINMNGSTEDYQREWMFWGEHLRFASDGDIWYIITPYINSDLKINYKGKTYDDFLRIKDELIDKLGGREKAPKRVWKTDLYGHRWTRNSMFNA